MADADFGYFCDVVCFFFCLCNSKNPDLLENSAVGTLSRADIFFVALLKDFRVFSYNSAVETDTVPLVFSDNRFSAANGGRTQQRMWTPCAENRTTARLMMFIWDILAHFKGLERTNVAETSSFCDILSVSLKSAEEARASVGGKCLWWCRFLMNPSR